MDVLLPERKDLLINTVDSIIDQIDHLYICLNGYKKIPYFLKNNKKITIHHGKNYGDAGKFLFLDKCKDSYYFSIDDDLIYPKNYVSRMIRFIDSKNKAVAVTAHGKILINNKYNYGNTVVFPFFRKITNDTKVHIVGTGVTAFYTNCLNLSINNFPLKYKNVGDIHFSVQCNIQNVNRFVIKHREHWVKDQESSKTIWNQYKNSKKMKSIIKLLLRQTYWKKINKNDNRIIRKTTEYMKKTKSYTSKKYKLLK